MTFENVPAFTVYLDAEVEVPDARQRSASMSPTVGMFYVIADAAQVGLTLTPEEASAAVRAGRDDQSGDDRAARATGTPRQSRNPRSYHQPAFGTTRSVPTPTGATPWSCRTGELDWDRPENLDRGARSLSLWYRNLGKDGDALGSG